MLQGFPSAYALASVSVIGMFTACAAVALHRMARGSIGLFAILAAIMFATRRVDWYAVRARGTAN